jgi:hypothetical protein
MHIDYLDTLPPIPKDLLDEITDIINLPKSPSLISEENPRFQTRMLNDKLTEWLSNYFKFEFKCHYQIISHEHRIHKDKGRAVAYNYILEQGGPNVITNVYDEDKTTVLQSEHIPLHRWHRIDVSKYHGVHNIQPGAFRYAISVSPLNYSLHFV